MANEIAVVEKAEVVPVIITNEQVDLIRRTVASGATADELELYFYDCKRQGVHPLDRLIHFTKRGGKYTPIIGIDFMRTRAHDTGECAGIGDPDYSGSPKEDGFTAAVTVKRIVQGQHCEFTASARWEEYYPGEQSGHMWRKMPHVMLGKCAEALALRKAFPRQLSGLYAREEMGQADAPHMGDRPKGYEGSGRTGNSGRPKSQSATNGDDAEVRFTAAVDRAVELKIIPSERSAMYNLFGNVLTDAMGKPLKLSPAIKLRPEWMQTLSEFLEAGIAQAEAAEPAGTTAETTLVPEMGDTDPFKDDA